MSYSSWLRLAQARLARAAESIMLSRFYPCFESLAYFTYVSFISIHGNFRL
jgi:hypothetical protein